MTRLSVASLGYSLPLPGVEQLDWDSKRSLLEFDIIIVEPSFRDIYKSERYNGKPLFGEHNSITTRETCHKWRTQILTAINSGKTVIASLNEFEEHYYYTGEVNWSGTGRNARKTNSVALINNYEIIPFDFKSRQDAVGVKMNAINDGSGFNTRWSKVSGFFQYQFFFSVQSAKPLVVVRGTENVVAALARSPGGGALFLIPPPLIDFENWQDEDDEWTEKVLPVGHTILEFFLFLKELADLGQSAEEHAPDWVSEERYGLPLEHTFAERLLEIDREVVVLRNEKEKIEIHRREYLSVKNLLYAKGEGLEVAVRAALNELGILAGNHVQGDFEFDIVFDLGGKRFLGEVEGKDSKAVDVSKISQLSRCLTEDFSRDEVEEYAKGILFGNPFRRDHPTDRPDAFTAKVVVAAERAGISLISTTFLYELVREARRSGSSEAAKVSLSKLIDHPGGIFPPA